MSARQKSQQAGSAQGMVVGMSKRRSPFGGSPLKIAAIVLVGVVLIAGIVYGVIHELDRHTKPASSNDTAAYRQAFQASLDGHPAALQKLLNQQLATAKSAQQKASIYSQQATAAWNGGQYDQALAFALQADKLNPTSDTAQLIANLYQQKNDPADEKLWLQKAIARLDKNAPVYQRTLNALNSQLAQTGS